MCVRNEVKHFNTSPNLKETSTNDKDIFPLDINNIAQYLI